MTCAAVHWLPRLSLVVRSARDPLFRLPTPNEMPLPFLPICESPSILRSAGNYKCCDLYHGQPSICMAKSLVCLLAVLRIRSHLVPDRLDLGSSVNCNLLSVAQADIQQAATSCSFRFIFISFHFSSCFSFSLPCFLLLFCIVCSLIQSKDFAWLCGRWVESAPCDVWAMISYEFCGQTGQCQWKSRP